MERGYYPKHTETKSSYRRRHERQKDRDQSSQVVTTPLLSLSGNYTIGVAQIPDSSFLLDCLITNL